MINNTYAVYIAVELLIKAEVGSMDGNKVATRLKYKIIYRLKNCIL
jgi:hypothetical protein